jgi:hypothetical protein
LTTHAPRSAQATLAAQSPENAASHRASRAEHEPSSRQAGSALQMASSVAMHSFPIQASHRPSFLHTSDRRHHASEYTPQTCVTYAAMQAPLTAQSSEASQPSFSAATQVYGPA